MILKLWRSENWMGWMGLKSKRQESCIISGGSRKEAIPQLFPDSGTGKQYHWFMATSLIFKPRRKASCNNFCFLSDFFSIATSCLIFYLLLFFFNVLFCLFVVCFFPIKEDRLFIYLFCLFAFSRASPTAYGGSQARGLIRAVAAGLH